jgi:ATP-dependent Zn protease
MYAKMGTKLLKGVLLVIFLFTEKSPFARTIIDETGCSSFNKIAEFNEALVGVGISRTRHIFKKARENVPRIIFIDEVDSSAGQCNNLHHIYCHNIIIQLMDEIDGFKFT